ncbi:MAG: DUF4395 domain-containing protein [Deltaproteobacteria bacterium]|jgi:hypothetical protein|nr:DUF4395 domain-containing protein [Deltaproteobacteria bacterium]
MTAEIDVNIPRFNQACVAALTGLAFVLQWWPLVIAVGVVLVATILGGPRYALFTRLYVRFIQPRTGGTIETEPSAPPRFAQLLGLGLLTVATVLFVLGLSTAGWVITLVVTALSALAAITQVCVGCRIYERVTS